MDGGKRVILPTRWFVRIDRWHPARLNHLLNSHWAVAARLKKLDANIIALACKGADVPRRSASVECRWKSRLGRVSVQATLTPIGSR